MNIYNQFVNFIRDMPSIWFLTIWFALFAGCLLLVMNFWKKHDGKQNSFVKLSLLAWAIILFALLIYLTYIRK